MSNFGGDWIHWTYCFFGCVFLNHLVDTLSSYYMSILHQSRASLHLPLSLTQSPFHQQSYYINKPPQHLSSDHHPHQCCAELGSWLQYGSRRLCVLRSHPVLWLRRTHTSMTGFRTRGLDNAHRMSTVRFKERLVTHFRVDG